jgi:hypothetical protein
MVDLAPLGFVVFAPIPQAITKRMASTPGETRCQSGMESIPSVQLRLSAKGPLFGFRCYGGIC